MSVILEAPALMFLAMLMYLTDTPASQCAASLKTVFGHVHVNAENAQIAIGEGEAAYLAARNVLALPDTRFDIADADCTSFAWGDRTSDGNPVYVWAFARGADNRTLPPPAYLLRHEIGHDLFIRYLAPDTKNNQYGGDAPDWLDEMAAVAFEGEALRATRRRVAVRYAKEGKLIPLRKFLTMTHPEMAAGSIPASSGQTGRAFEAVSRDTPLFYAMASSFYDFLVTRTESPAIVAELAAAFRNGEALEQWLPTRAGHSGIEALDADFLTWIASDKRYGGASQ